MGCSKKGFTLIEMVVSITIVSIIAGIAAPLLAVMVQAMVLHMDRIDLNEASEFTVSRMSREIRRLRDDESVVTATAAEYEFVDIDGRSIRYHQTGSDLLRQVDGGADAVLADNLQAGSLGLVYYDDQGNTLGAPLAGLGTATDLRRVEINMVFAEGAETLPVTVTVRPRNLRHANELFP